MSATGKIELVGDIKTQTDRSQMALETAARIEDTDDVVVAEVADIAEEVAEGGGTIAEMEIHETTFKLDEGVNMPVFAEVDFRSKLAMENTHAGALDRYAAGSIGGETLSKGTIEIVVQFRFQLDVAKSYETEAGADTGEIRIRLRKTEVVSIDAELKMLGFLGGRERHEPPR